VVSVTDPYGRVLGFLDRESNLIIMLNYMKWYSFCLNILLVPCYGSDVCFLNRILVTCVLVARGLEGQIPRETQRCMCLLGASG
jgi:hypothetical protein